jgi:periplasmic copper chaperone A
MNKPFWTVRVLFLLALGCAAGMARPAHAQVLATEAWSRATPPGATTAVGYMLLTNTSGEERKLLKIVSPVCDMVSVHRSSVDSQGVSRMWPVGSLKIDAGASVRFEPNGLHLMFTGIKAPFQAGTKVPLVLRFEGDDQDITVQLEVRPLVPAATDVHAHNMQ